MKYTFSLLLLSLFTMCCYAQSDATPKIRYTKSSTYQAIQKDTSFVTGDIVANIHFGKYDNKGRKWVERISNEQGEALKQIQHV